MPIKIADSLPARAVLESENIFVMTEHRAATDVYKRQQESMQRKLYLHTPCALLSHSQSESVIYFFTPSKLNNSTRKLSFEVT